eukprot:937006-Amorphochlora_amoeboformis.AAC.1
MSTKYRLRATSDDSVFCCLDELAARLTGVRAQPGVSWKCNLCRDFLCRALTQNRTCSTDHYHHLLRADQRCANTLPHTEVYM